MLVNEIKLDFDDVLIVPAMSDISSRSEIDLLRTFHFTYTKRNLECVPICAANMDTTGTFNMSELLSKHKMITCLHKHYKAEYLIDYFKEFRPYTFYSTGISNTDQEKMTYIFDILRNRYGQILPNVCIDVANGYSEKFADFNKKLKDKYPDIITMSGNVVTPDIVNKLTSKSLVDIVKIGIGPGSVCTTRLKTGIGYPQFSAIMECSEAAHENGAYICSDGGCKTSGDICKAFGVGADMVMLGGMLAGTDCCEGEWEYEYLCKTVDQKGNFIREWWQAHPPGYHTDKRKKSLKFYGMSSKEAMTKHNGGVANYRASEGKCVSIEYKGKTLDTINDILGGIRSCCSYTGHKTLSSLIGNTNFIQVKRTHNNIYEKQ